MTSSAGSKIDPEFLAEIAPSAPMFFSNPGLPVCRGGEQVTNAVVILAATTTNWGSSISSFLNTSLGGVVSKAFTALAVVFIIFGVAHAVWTHGRGQAGGGWGKVIRRAIEVIALGVVLATPTLWGPIASFVATIIGDIANWVGGL